MSPLQRIDLNTEPGFNPSADQIARDREALLRTRLDALQYRMTGNTILLDGERGPESIPVTYPEVILWPAEKFGQDEDGVLHIKPSDPLFVGLAAVDEQTRHWRDKDGNRHTEYQVHIEFPWTGLEFPAETTAQVTTANGSTKLYRMTETYANGVRAVLEGTRAR